MTYEEIYKKIEEYCNTCSEDEFNELDFNSDEMSKLYDICRELEEFIEKNYTDLFYEVFYDIAPPLEESPHSFLEEFPTEKDYIEWLIEDVDTTRIAEWVNVEFDREQLIKDYINQNMMGAFVK